MSDEVDFQCFYAGGEGKFVSDGDLWEWSCEYVCPFFIQDNYMLGANKHSLWKSTIPCMRTTAATRETKDTSVIQEAGEYPSVFLCYMMTVLTQ